MAQEKSLVETLKVVPKAIFFGVGAVIIGVVCKKAGFPNIFVFMWEMFWLASFLFALLLDMPAIKKPSVASGTIGFFVTFVIGTVLVSYAGYTHPQYVPAFEIEKLNKAPIKSLPTGPEAIAAGKELYSENKCFNCHKAAGEGSSNRGPHFDNVQIGVYPNDWLIEQIVDPLKQQHPGFDDEKSKKAMPDYYGEDIEGMEMDLLLVFLKSLKDPTKMPVRGREGAYKKWDEDPEMIEIGKKVYMGEYDPAFNCSVCHGADGTPLMSGAADFRQKGWKSNQNTGKTFADLSDGEWYKSVMLGVPNTAMAAWGDMGMNDYQAWTVIAYIKSTWQK